MCAMISVSTNRCAPLRHLGLQGLKQIGTARAQTSRQVQYLRDGLALDQRFDHGTSGLTVNIGYQHIEPDTGVGEQFVQPVC